MGIWGCHHLWRDSVGPAYCRLTGRKLSEKEEFWCIYCYSDCPLYRKYPRKRWGISGYNG